MPPNGPDRPLGVALIGCGTIASTHADALASLPDARLAAVCDLLPERAARFPAQSRPWPSILASPDIDAAIVCLPSGLHARFGEEALRAGKHVLIEKPMDVTVAACDRLIAAQRETGRTLAVVSQHRYDRASQRVFQALERGELGEIIQVDARIPWFRTQEYYDSGDWRGTWAMDGGGCLMNQGVHTVDLMRWLAGPVETISAVARTASHTGIEVEDALCAALTFTNGAMGTLFASTCAFPGFPARLALYGTRGTAVIEGDALQMLAVQGAEPLPVEEARPHAVQVAAGGTRASSLAPEWGESHRAQIAEFLHCCRTGATPLVDGPAGRAAVEIITAAYESARTGAVVPLAPTGSSA